MHRKCIFLEKDLFIIGKSTIFAPDKTTSTLDNLIIFGSEVGSVLHQPLSFLMNDHVGNV